MFTNTNADPQNGSPWPSSVQVYNRDIVLANPTGVYVSYGGAVTKISDQLDGIYNTVLPPFAAPNNTDNYPSAVADLYGSIRVYVLLLPIIDQVTGVRTNKLLIWNKKSWFTASQSLNLTYITGQKFSSALTAWGTDGTSIYPLFTNPSTAVTKTVQSKLWATPGYYFTKQMLRLLGIVQNSTGGTISLRVTCDNETNSSPAVTVVVPGTSLFDVFGPIPLGNSGRLLGISVQTEASDAAIMSMTMINQTFETNV
jgi:hypothetical protein